MAIYNRDNFAALNDAALANALARRQAAVDRAAQRRTGNFEAIGRALPVFGRTAEEGMVPDQYRDDPEYRAARFDYIYGGDRSGLDSYRQARAAHDEAELARKFQAAEAEKNRQFQMAENALNRKLQGKIQGDERVKDKARMLAGIRDAQAVVKDAEDNPTKYTELQKAQARSALRLQLDLAEKSGWFDKDELNMMKGIRKPGAENNMALAEAAGAGKVVPPEEVPAGQPEETGNPIIDWENFKNDAKNAKTLEDIEVSRKRLAGIKPTEANVKERNETSNVIDAKEKEIKNRMAAAAKTKSMMDQAKTHKFSKTDLREKLQMGKEGGGLKEAELDWSFTHNGKTFPAKAKIINKGDFGDIVVDGKVVQQNIPLY